MATGHHDLAAALREQEQVALASSASISTSDLDYAYQLQLDEAIQASLRSPNADDAAIREDRRAHDGPALRGPGSEDSSSPCPLFRVFTKGLASSDVVGPRDRDPGIAVLAVAVCGPQGDVVLSTRKPVEGLVGGRMTLEVMALVEGLHAALGLGIRSVTVVTDYRPLYNHMLGIWNRSGKKLADADLMNQVLLARNKFDQCEVSLVERRQVNCVIELARDSLTVQVAKALAASVGKEKRETCTICLEDTVITKIHVVEGCAHRFCFPCMKEHVKVKLRNGTLPACPQDGCATKLSVKGSKVFLSQQLLKIMVQRVREGQIPPGQKIYCPYPKCSALMSLEEVIHPMQATSSKYTIADAVTSRKCVKCRRSFCVSCKVPWHDCMSCYEYKMRHPYARPEDAKLQNLAQQELWRQCVKCNHMIELAEGCFHMICVCGYEFCYTCGKEWKEKKASCSCPLWDERNIIRDDGEDDESEEDEDGLF